MGKTIAILGSTGSIGTQTLEVVRENGDITVAALSAGSNITLLEQQVREFSPRLVAVWNPEKAVELKTRLADMKVKVVSGMEGLLELAVLEEVEILVTAIVGMIGIRPTMAAIEAGKDIALANKETLVAAGSLVMGLAQKHNAPILPVDSEHSAIFQCLLGAHGNAPRLIHLTASGGPFRTWEKERIAAATKDMALKHPNWNMGAKITIDSATMMNKGFEVIEAKWLFNLEPDKINVVVHPESIIHSMVEFEDGAVIAQMGCPDMREPIQLALSFPARLPLNNRKLDFPKLGSLSFFEPDTDRFPALSLAFKAIRRGGNIPCALNAANEAAVAAFLNDRISFYDISRIVEECMDGTFFVAEPGLDDIFATNKDAFERAQRLIDKK